MLDATYKSLLTYLSAIFSPTLQSARRLQHEKDVVVSLSHESRALQSRLEAEQDAIQRMEAVLALVERFPSGETPPGDGPTLQVGSRLIFYKI